MISLNIKVVGFTAVKDTRMNRMTKLIALKWLLIAAVNEEESRFHRLFSIQPLFVWPLYSPQHTASCRIIVLSRKYGPFLRIFMRSAYQGNEVSKGVLGYVLIRADSYWAWSPRATKSKGRLPFSSSSSSFFFFFFFFLLLFFLSLSRTIQPRFRSCVPSGSS